MYSGRQLTLLKHSDRTLIASPIFIPHESRVKFLAAMKQAHPGLDVDLPEGSPFPEQDLHLGLC